MHPEIQRRVDRFAVDLRSSPVRDDVLAVVVSGSAARGEERWIGDELVSDIDLMVVSRSSTAAARSDAEDVAAVLAATPRQASRAGASRTRTLDYATLANYEARHRGVVVYGDPTVLEPDPDGRARPTSPPGRRCG